MPEDFTPTTLASPRNPPRKRLRDSHEADVEMEADAEMEDEDQKRKGKHAKQAK